MKRLIYGLGLFILLVGCEKFKDWEYTHITGRSAIIPSTPEKIFDAAIDVLATSYYISSQNRTRMFLKATSNEYSSKGKVGSVADVLGPSERRFRKVVYIKVNELEPGKCKLTVRVEVQRNDTTDVRTFAYQRQADDRPANMKEEYLINNYGNPKYQKWSVIKRDYATEQEIMERIKAEISR